MGFMAGGGVTQDTPASEEAGKGAMQKKRILGVTYKQICDRRKTISLNYLSLDSIPIKTQNRPGKLFPGRFF